MKINDIMTLAKAGFTAQQIAALNATNAVQPQTTQTSLVNPFSGNAVSAQTSQNSDALALANLLMASQPAAQTTDDILASIINPATNQGGGVNNG